MKKLKKILKMEIPKPEMLNIWLSLFPMLMGVGIYSFLSVTTPSYINLSNTEFTNRMIGMLIIIPIPLILNILLMGTPRIDPLYKNYRKFSKTYEIFRRVIIIFFDLLIVGTLAMMLGVEINLVLYSCVTVGCLLLLIGATLKDTKQNYFFGIRTPWALLDEKNWEHTQNFGGALMILSGMLIISLGLLNLDMIILILAVVIIFVTLAIWPFLVSYNYYLKHK